MELTLRRFARQAALGAIAVAAGALALYVLLARTAWPVPRGGMDHTLAVITLISVAIPIAVIVAAHVVYARILFRYGREMSE